MTNSNSSNINRIESIAKNLKLCIEDLIREIEKAKNEAPSNTKNSKNAHKIEIKIKPSNNKEEAKTSPSNKNEQLDLPFGFFNYSVEFSRIAKESPEEILRKMRNDHVNSGSKCLFKSYVGDEEFKTWNHYAGLRGESLFYGFESDRVSTKNKMIGLSVYPSFMMWLKKILSGEELVSLYLKSASKSELFKSYTTVCHDNRLFSLLVSAGVMPKEMFFGNIKSCGLFTTYINEDYPCGERRRMRLSVIKSAKALEELFEIDGKEATKIISKNINRAIDKK